MTFYKHDLVHIVILIVLMTMDLWLSFDTITPRLAEINFLKCQMAFNILWCFHPCSSFSDCDHLEGGSALLSSAGLCGCSSSSTRLLHWLHVHINAVSEWAPSLHACFRDRLTCVHAQVVSPGACVCQ